MVILFFGFNTYAPFAYEKLDNEVPPELAVRGVHHIARGSGYGTRTSLMSVAVGGPLRLYWTAERFGGSSPLRSIVSSMILSLPGVLVFWLWVGWMVDTRGQPILPRHLALRVLLCGSYLAVLYWSVKRAWWSFDFAIINGAGETRTWARLFSHGFIADSLSWFIGGVWLVIFAVLLLIASICLWTAPIQSLQISK